MYVAIDSKDGKIGVIDTTDGIVEYYTKETLLGAMNQGIVVTNLDYNGDILTKLHHNLSKHSHTVVLRPHTAPNSLLHTQVYRGMSVSGMLLCDVCPISSVLNLSNYFGIRCEVNLDMDYKGYLERIFVYDIVLRYFRSMLLHADLRREFKDILDIYMDSGSSTVVLDFLRYAYQEIYGISLGAVNRTIKLDDELLFDFDKDEFLSNVVVFEYKNYVCFTDGVVLVKLSKKLLDGDRIKKSMTVLAKGTLAGTLDNVSLGCDGFLTVTKSDNIELNKGVWGIKFTKNARVNKLTVNECSTILKYPYRDRGLRVGTLEYNYDLGFEWFINKCVVKDLVIPLVIARKVLTFGILTGDIGLFSLGKGNSITFTGSFSNEDANDFVFKLIEPYYNSVKSGGGISFSDRKAFVVLGSGNIIEYLSQDLLMFINAVVDSSTMRSIHISLGEQFKTMVLSSSLSKYIVADDFCHNLHSRIGLLEASDSMLYAYKFGVVKELTTLYSMYINKLSNLISSLESSTNFSDFEFTYSSVVSSRGRSYTCLIVNSKSLGLCTGISLFSTSIGDNNFKSTDIIMNELSGFVFCCKFVGYLRSKGCEVVLDNSTISPIRDKYSLNIISCTLKGSQVVVDPDYMWGRSELNYYTVLGNLIINSSSWKIEYMNISGNTLVAYKFKSISPKTFFDLVLSVRYNSTDNRAIDITGVNFIKDTDGFYFYPVSNYHIIAKRSQESIVLDCKTISSRCGYNLTYEFIDDF